MYTCPHCHARTVTAIRKWWSDMAPVICRDCGGYSEVAGSGIFGVSLLVLVLSGVAASEAAIGTGAVLLFLGLGLPFSTAVYLGLWHRATLLPITRERAEAKRALGLGAVLLMAVLSLFN